MGELLQPWHLIVFPVLAFLVFLAISRMPKKH